MRKILSFVLIVPLLFGCLAVPAEAAELDNNDLLYVLDYGFADFGDSNVLNGNISEVRDFFYILPYEMSINYLDMVVFCNTGTLNDLTCGEVPVRVMPIGNGFYRVFGASDVPIDTDLLFFDMDVTGPYVVEIVSLYVGLVTITEQQDKVKFWVTASSQYSEVTWNPGDELTSIYFTGEGYEDSFIASFYPLNWERYDYFDMVFFMEVSEINSISCVVNGVVVPFDVQYLQTGSTYGDYQRVVVRMDLRGLDKTGPDPILQVAGLCLDGENGVYFSSGTGIVATDYEDPDTFFLRNIWDSIVFYFNQLRTWLTSHFENLKTWLADGFQSVVDAINPETDADDKVAEDVAQKTDELDQVGEALESVEKPPVADMDFGVGDYVSTSNVTMATMGLSSVMASEYIGSIFMISVILAFAGFVLYGKR